MAHWLFNFSDGYGEQATALLRAKMWAVGPHEGDRGALAPGDLVLIYLPAPEAKFIGRAELATAFRDWTSSEAEVYPGESPSGVLLSHVEEWEPAVPMGAVVQRIDPTGSNPLVQANAAAGFQSDVVRITRDEYEATVALSREARETR
ncbi:MAG TPA: hypothetical protein VLK36_12770 [Gaiellaceae bacterium]|nr:hypothetical protein [Gaiellaceae bacterium]